jgi:hypothetical protein
VTLPAVFIVFFAGRAILSGRHINIAISHPAVVRALFGAALYLIVTGCSGWGSGVCARPRAQPRDLGPRARVGDRVG